jgi:GxxExxY protein
MGLKVERQSEITILYDEIILDLAFRIDLLVEGKVIIEIRDRFSSIHFKQVTNYLKLTDKKACILVNFNTTNI